MPFAAALAAGANLVGGYLQGKSAEKAARTQAAAQERAGQLAAEEARFRPVGITTRFGQSQFQYGPEGRVTGAGYTLTPELAAMQDRFLGLAGGGLTQAEQAQQQFAPLQGAAQGLFGLGQQYLAQSPEAAAQQYMAGQQNLLAPGRERAFSQLQNQMFQTGRGGLSVGATGARPSGAAGLGAANPDLEAYYNAIAQQDAALAAQAQQAGQQQTAFGATLFGTGGELARSGYQSQAAALDPYAAYLKSAAGLESLGQQPLTMGQELGGRVASPGGAQVLLTGNMPSQQTFQANAYNPFASALSGFSQNPQLTQAAGSLFGAGGGINRMMNPSGNPLQTGQYADPGYWT